MKRREMGHTHKSQAQNKLGNTQNKTYKRHETRYAAPRGGAAAPQDPAQNQPPSPLQGNVNWSILWRIEGRGHRSTHGRQKTLPKIVLDNWSANGFVIALPPPTPAPKPHEQYAEMLANFEDWAAMKAPSIPAFLKKPPMMKLYGPSYPWVPTPLPKPPKRSTLHNFLNTV